MHWSCYNLDVEIDQISGSIMVRKIGLQVDIKFRVVKIVSVYPLTYVFKHTKSGTTSY